MSSNDKTVKALTEAINLLGNTAFDGRFFSEEIETLKALLEGHLRPGGNGRPIRSQTEFEAAIAELESIDVDQSGEAEDRHDYLVALVDAYDLASSNGFRPSPPGASCWEMGCTGLEE